MANKNNDFDPIPGVFLPTSIEKTTTLKNMQISATCLLTGSKFTLENPTLEQLKYIIDLMPNPNNVFNYWLLKKEVLSQIKTDPNTGEVLNCMEIVETMTKTINPEYKLGSFKGKHR